MAKSKITNKSIKTKSKSNSANVVKNHVALKTPMLNIVLSGTCIVIAVWFSYKGYLETRVNTPYSTEKLARITGLEVPDRYWGTYRPGIYFGLKTRDPHSLVTGLMWYSPRRLHADGSSFRHWCDQGDKLDRYAWLAHDGRTFGIQEIVDNSAVLKTTFVKRPGGNHGGDWSSRITVTSENGKRDGEELSLLFYAAIDANSKGKLSANRYTENNITGIKGNTPGLGSFNIMLNVTQGTMEAQSFLSTFVPTINIIKETVLESFKIAIEKNSSKKHIVLPGEKFHSTIDKNEESNFVGIQITGIIPFEIEVAYESGSFSERTYQLVGQNYDTALKEKKRLFDEKFENVFKLKAKGFSSRDIAFAKMTLSNMMGSIGYFYGNSQVQSKYTKGPVPYWKSALYTAVPSRSFFPRGFLWDEGFHGLLISTWDLEIELDVINHWFDLMNVEGWIPREMILGEEALARVPEEFVTQINTNANPPTFFLTLHYILQHHREVLFKQQFDFLDKLYPRLEVWFNWFNTTQVGELPGTYRWRGRDATTIKELNPKTLTSGLDDYPRSSHPDLNEYHVDLRCWIAFAANTLSQIADILNNTNYKYEETYKYLSNNDLLNKLHWSSNAKSYSDYGLHTDKTVLHRITPPSRSHASSSEVIRVVLENPTLRHVDTSFGYVSLFPFLLQMIDPNSPQIEKILDDLIDPDLLWTQYGLRSLAKKSPLYMKYNTEHDPPYWRGAIWMNLNYLTVRALHHYSSIESPYQSKAKMIYTELRQNLIQNVIRQYKKTGYVWENYDDKYGDGKGSHPFTGWTSLVLLLMAEIY